MLVFLLLFFVDYYTPLGERYCDYDSCSQKIHEWNFSGSICFSNDNPDCTDFLGLWNKCQGDKGVNEC